jgi:hypothetical protein
MSIRRVSPAAASLVTLAVCLVATQANANDGLRLSLDWGKLADMLHDGAPFLRQESSRSVLERGMHPASTPEAPWLVVSPHVSLVARDWSGAQLLVGHLMLTDQVRLSRSCRMLLSRVRIAAGRFAPFAQAGLGQWRVDTDLMPTMPRDVEMAGQLGGGFEFAVSRSATIALEADYTILYREQHEPQMISEPRPWVTFLAARARF